MALTGRVIFTPDIAVPMRDGVVLKADMFRPDDDAPHPVILARTPYNKQLADPPRPWLKYASAGYIVVVQDCRGRHASEGHFEPFRDEMNDGYDTVEWIATQGWCTGKVGMYGTSYLGVTQWLAAAASPPHLTTIVPSFTASDYHDGWIYHSGALLLSFALGWTLPFALGEVQRLPISPSRKEKINAQIVRLIDDMPNTMSHLPLNDIEVLSDNQLASYYFDWLQHPDDDDYWRQWNIEEYHHKIGIPVLSIGGWYDIFLRGTLRNFLGMRSNGGSEVARNGQRLIIGPWTHNKPLFGGNPDPTTSFGLASTSLDVEEIALRWFDYWLAGKANDVPNLAPVTLFTLGENRWKDFSDWPIAGTDSRKFFLHSAGHANSDLEDGSLSLSAPGYEPEDLFVFDPRNPVPTVGGPAFGDGGARDQRRVENRSEVLVYTTQPLEQNLEITGPVEVKLFISTSARDTDFTAKLLDVRSDGYAMNVADDICRMRYRHGPSVQNLLEPETVYECTISIPGISVLFKKGHRIRLEVSSSNFPRFDPNANTGEPFGKDSIAIPALQRVFHSDLYPSHLRLPDATTMEIA